MNCCLEDEFLYRVLKEDNFNSICEKFNTCKENIIRNNKSIDLYEGEMIKIKVNKFLMHYVKPTENLDVISNIYNIDKAKIIQDNNLSSEKLFIGQGLKIYNLNEN